MLLTHVNLVNNGRFIAQYLRLSEEDRIAIPVPLFHCFGSVIGTMAAAVTGAASVFPRPLSTRARPSKPSSGNAARPCTVSRPCSSPSCSTRISRDFDLSSLRTGVMAGAPCPIEIMRRVVGDMHCAELVVAYGQTEASPVITMSRAEDSLETRCTTVGCALPETEVRIVSPVTGETVPAGEQGELLARGYMVMSEYDGEPEATRQAIDARRLAAYRRPGRDARGRLLPHHRPRARHDHPRGRERLSARNRGVSVHASQGLRRPGGGAARRTPWGMRVGLDPAEARRNRRARRRSATTAARGWRTSRSRSTCGSSKHFP